MNIVVVIERIQKVGNLFARGRIQFWKCFREVADFRRNNVPAGGFERFGNGIEIFDFREEPRALLPFGNLLVFERLDFLRA